MVLPFKYREIVRSGPPGLRRDQMIYGTPSGSIDVVFVVENSTNASRVDISGRGGFDLTAGNFPPLRTQNVPPQISVLGWLTYHYAQLAHWFSEARAVNYHVHLVTASRRSMANRYLERSDQVHTEHFAAVMPTARGPNWMLPFNSPLFLNTENERLYPFYATHWALSAAGFSDRAHVPLLLIYLLLDDAWGEDFSEHYQELEKTLKDSNRDPFQTRVIAYTNLLGGNRLPFVTSMYTLSELDRLHNSRFSLEKYDLSTLYNNPHEKDLSAILWHHVIQMTNGEVAVPPSQIQFILSQIPQRPEMMTVRSHNRVFHAGTDYNFNPAKNALEFNVAAGLQLGDPIEAAYFITPPDDLLPGGVGPGPRP